ncbi:MAG: 2-amino-4-hydroxy-6-hydroxymethyldihydropteridine diphosphokinase [Thermoanaerobaculia bacterium]
MIALGLGSNLGDSESTLRRAVEELTDLLGPLDVAPLYRSAPISPIPQPDFFNTVAIAEIDRRSRRTPAPRRLLAAVKELERLAGRGGGGSCGPRPLDVDLLLYGDLILSPEPGQATPLALPHPRMRQRRFVLAPLCDLRPDLRLPPDGAAVRDLLAALGTEQRIEKVGWRP